jgi:hypothetical protein
MSGSYACWVLPMSSLAFTAKVGTRSRFGPSTQLTPCGPYSAVPSTKVMVPSAAMSFWFRGRPGLAG